MHELSLLLKTSVTCLYGLILNTFWTRKNCLKDLNRTDIDFSLVVSPFF